MKCQEPPKQYNNFILSYLHQQTQHFLKTTNHFLNHIKGNRKIAILCNFMSHEKGLNLTEVLENYFVKTIINSEISTK